MHFDNENNKDAADVEKGEHKIKNEAEHLLSKTIDPDASVSGSSSTSASDVAVQHRLGGPVGMPGEGARQELAVVHSVGGIDGATTVILGDEVTPSVYIGGRLTDVLEIGKKMCNDAGDREEMKKKYSHEHSRRGGSVGGFGSVVGNSFKRSSIHSRFPTPNELKQANNNNNNNNNNNEEEDGRWVSCSDDPSVLVFHGISTWAEGQLEGEIRSGAWAYGDASFEDIMEDNPSDLWRSLMRSDRVGLLV